MAESGDVKMVIRSATGIVQRHDRTPGTASATGSGFAASVAGDPRECDSIILRLSEIRGALDAKRNDGDRTRVRESRTLRSPLGFGAPRSYDRLHFLVG